MNSFLPTNDFDTIVSVMNRVQIIFMYSVTTALYISAILFFAPFRNFDTDSYSQIGSLILKGINIYPDPAISRHPYLPLFLYIEATSVYVNSIFPSLSTTSILKSVITVFHLFSIYSVYILSKKNIKLTALYALNPISLLVITFHGQFDIIPLSFLLYGIVLLRQKKYLHTILLLSLAVTVKTWPILFIIPYLKRIPKKFFGVVLAFPLISIVVYLIFFDSTLWSIIRVLLVYQGVQGVWGIGALLQFISDSRIISFLAKLIFLAIIITFSLRQKKSGLIEEITSLMFAFFLLTPGFGIQWFMWLVPFLFISKKPFIGMLYFPIMLAIHVSYATWIEIFGLNTYLGNTVLHVLYPLFGILLIIQKIVPQTPRL